MKRQFLAAVLVTLPTLLLNGLAAQTASDVVCTGCVNTTDLAANAVTTGKIADGQVKTPDLAANAVTTGKILDGTVAFNDLSSGVIAFLGSAIENISTVKVSWSAAAVASAVCPSDRIPIAASCSCDDEDGTRNYGVLFGCDVTGTGAIAGCFDEAITFDPFLPVPMAKVTAVCLGATSVDGTPWLPSSAGLTDSTKSVSGTKSVSSSSTTSEAEAQWIAEQQAAHEAALVDAQKKHSAYSSRIRQRQQ